MAKPLQASTAYRTIHTIRYDTIHKVWYDIIRYYRIVSYHTYDMYDIVGTIHTILWYHTIPRYVQYRIVRYHMVPYHRYLCMTGEPLSTTMERQGDRAVFYHARSTKATWAIGIYITIKIALCEK